MKKLLSIVLVAMMLATACLVPVSAEGEVQLIDAFDFDSAAVGAISKNGSNVALDANGIVINNYFRVVDSMSKVVNRYGNNNAFRYDKAAGAEKTYPDNSWVPFSAIGAANFSKVTTDMVISYDAFVSDDDGGSVALFNQKGKASNKWGNALLLDAFDDAGTARISWKNPATGKYQSSTLRVNRGEWFNLALVITHDAADTTYANVDAYVNGQLALSGIKVYDDFFNMTVIKFQTQNACPADCYIMMDNFRAYTGSELKSDAELGLNNGAIFAGIQESAVVNNAFSVRLIGAVDALTYDSVGFEVTATYTEGGSAQTKTLKKATSNVYTKITANSDAGIAEYTAEDLGGQYLYALSIRGIPATLGEMTLEVKTYSVTDGVETVQSIYLITYNNGVFVSLVEA
ncbi:MAG: hypothetical protein E7620_03205 [Ruminococcaceae bacterium]|nr:hypothetical protein [Oscillospiraceae bacterium]